jgi:hypothetical protein
MMKIYPKIFCPKESFVKSIPGEVEGQDEKASHGRPDEPVKVLEQVVRILIVLLGLDVVELGSIL